MKKLLSMLLVVLLLGGAIIGYALWNASALMERYKPQIEARLSELANTPVRFGALDLSLWPETGIRVESFRLGQTKASEGVKLQDLILKLNVQALLGGRIEITELTLAAPKITLVRNSEGITVSGLAKKQQKSSEGTAGKPSVPTKEKTSNTTPVTPSKSDEESGFSLQLKKLNITGAEIVLKDEIFKRNFELEKIDITSEIDLNSKRVLLNALQLNALFLQRFPIELEVPALEYSLVQGNVSLPKVLLGIFESEISATGEYSVPQQSGQFTLHSKGLQLSPPLELAREVLPTLPEMEIEGVLTPDFQVTLSKGGKYKATGPLALSIDRAEMASQILSKIQGKVHLNATEKRQALGIERLNFDYKDTPFAVSGNSYLENQKLFYNDVKLEAFQGNVTTSGSLSLGTAKLLNSRFKLVNFQISELLRTFMPAFPLSAQGNLSEITGEIASELGADLMKKLRGKIFFQVKDGIIKEFNLAKEVVGSLTELPFISDALLNRIPEEKRAILASSDTEIKTLTADLRIENGRAHTDNLNLINDTFLLEGQGWLGLDVTADLSTQLQFQKDFTDVLVQSVKELRYGLNDQGRLELPVKIVKSATSTRVLPDLNRLLKASAKTALKEKASDLLNKALKNSSDSDSDPKKEATKQLIQKGLGALGF